jgi:hypothetical protein
MLYTVTINRTGHPGRTLIAQSAQSAAALAEAVTWMSGTRTLHVTIERSA